MAHYAVEEAMIISIEVLWQCQKSQVVKGSNLTSYVVISDDVVSVATSDKVFGVTGLEVPASVSK